MEIERLGPYQIVGRLGRGGMGTVYEGVHRETGEAAAIKLLSAEFAHEGAFRSRFEAEIETLRKLNHPNIVRLFGFGEQDGYLFYAMELVDGSSLEEELRRGRIFTWDEVARIGVATCQALRHAHDRGIIHRDIKPANILQAQDGQIKLSDFGIARFFGSSGLTSAGSVLGTAEYMAPEQAAGRPVDARADLYSLGGVMYVLLARRPLFHGKSLPEVLHKQQHEIPAPINRYAADVPEGFSRILSRLLEKDPSLRFPNANVLMRRLEAVLQEVVEPPQTLEAEVEWPAGASAADAKSPGAPTDDANEETRIVEPSSIDLASSQAPDAMETTMAATDLHGSPTEKMTVAPPPTHFVPVSEDELDAVEAEPEPPVFSWQTGVLVLMLVLIAAGIWWALQPPTADSLYVQIIELTPEGMNDAVLDAHRDKLESLVQDFLNRYADDSRARYLRSYQKDIELYNLQRKFNLRIRGLGSHERLLPIEEEYLEAIGYVNLEPEWGAARLQALLDLYGNATDASGPTGQCLILIRRRLAKVQDLIEQNQADQLSLLQDRLKDADKLRAADPQAAAAIYLAVVELCAKKQWAAEPVRHARKALAELAQQKPATR